tara:strand:- start:1144 stop:1455 length:312 start_codon:yes stop_codon:yes gene_type:complete
MSKTPPRELEHKVLRDEVNRETQNRTKGIDFESTVWWFDLVVGIIGIVIIAVANDKMKVANQFPNTKGHLRTLWLLLYPIGAFLAISILLGIRKLYRKIKNDL